ncbi:MAG: phage scaffolding protein [Oscillospiraceae bacterium]|nr:phage scaffolding protein [Oscillospiraceae bacterium]
MKNIHTILSEYGITIPEDKKAEFDKAVAENYKTSAEHEKKVNRLTDDYNAEKKRADEAVETLKGFDGKDFDAITRERDEWKKKHDEAVADHKRQQEDREFSSALENAISEAKGKNAKAIMALLDIEKLRGSRNLEKDIKSALDAVRTESGYLFEDNGGKPHFSTNKTDPGSTGILTREDIMKIPDRAERRAAMAKNQHLFTKGE